MGQSEELFLIATGRTKEPCRENDGVQTVSSDATLYETKFNPSKLGLVAFKSETCV